METLNWAWQLRQMAGRLWTAGGARCTPWTWTWGCRFASNCAVCAVLLCRRLSIAASLAGFCRGTQQTSGGGCWTPASTRGCYQATCPAARALQRSCRATKCNIRGLFDGQEVARQSWVAAARVQQHLHAPYTERHNGTPKCTDRMGPPQTLAQPCREPSTPTAIHNDQRHCLVQVEPCTDSLAACWKISSWQCLSRQACCTSPSCTHSTRAACHHFSAERRMQQWPPVLAHVGTHFQ